MEKAIALNPANPDYHNNLGVVEMRRNHLDAAEKRFEQCVYLDTGHGRCINNLAECLVRMERDNGAVALLLSHLSPATAYNNLGGVYMILGRRETARKMFLKALDLSPHLPAAMHNLNLMDEGEGRPTMKLLSHHPVSVIGTLIPAVMILFGGCAASPTAEELNPDFGKSVQAAFAIQVIHPEGPSDPSPCDLLPGDLADQIYNKRYIKSMTEEKKEKEDAYRELSGLK